MEKSDLKILFINPCLRRGATLKILPVGLASVMTYVKSCGYSFDLLDVDLNEYSDQEIEQYLIDNSYDVIMYGSIVTHYKWIKWLTNTIKRLQPSCRVVVGNSVAGSCYKVFLRNTSADAVVIGEGEITAAEVLEVFRMNLPLVTVQGIAFRDELGNVIKTEKRKACKIDSLPIVEWEFFDVNQYLQRGEGSSFGADASEGRPIVAMPVASARGCAFRCTFCHFVFWDDPYRYRSPDSILIEIKRNIECYGANYINFWDDLSFASIPQVERMVDAILDSGLKFQWSAAIRVDLLGNSKFSIERRLRLAERMKASGCTAVGFSLESANSEILEMMEKRVKPEYFGEQVKILQSVGIVCNVSVVFGYPIESPETIKETFNMCLVNRIYPSIGYLLPLPYTGMYEYALANNFILDEDKYLTEITERQDLCLNMTKMADEEVMSCIKDEASRLSKILELGLDDSSYLKTGGYKRHTNKGKQLAVDDIAADKLRRNENDFSFNYSGSVFVLDKGIDDSI